MIHCQICFSSSVDEHSICDTCNELYCDECSYTFTPHYQFQGSRCYFCANQGRRNKLTKEAIKRNRLELSMLIRDEKLNQILE